MRSVVLDTDTSSQILKKRLPIALATKLINTRQSSPSSPALSWPSGLRSATGGRVTAHFPSSGWPGYR
jgi:hypothetical protein